MESKQLLVTDHEQQADSSNSSRRKFFLLKYLDVRRRYFVAFLSFLGFLNVYTLRVILSVAILAMEEDFEEYKGKKGFILSSFYYGYIISQIPSGWVSYRYGGKKVFGISVLITSILCLLTPFVAKNYQLLIAIRVLQGIAEGSTYPSIQSVWSFWAPQSERTRLSTISFSGSYIGTVLSLSISGFISETYGWEYIFWAFGTAAALWSIIWLVNVGETPSEDKYISEDEQDFIESSLSHPVSSYFTGDIPYKQILCSKPVWAIIAAHFSENWGFYTLLMFFPTYMQDLKLSTSALFSGMLSALPYLIMAIVVQISGAVADRARTFKGTTFVRKLFTCTAFIVQAIFTLAAGQAADPYVSIACLSLAVGLGGIAWSGFSVNMLDIGGHYAGVLMAISNTFATIPGIISPLLVGQTPIWAIVFGTSAFIYLIGAIFYFFFASGDEQPWATATRHIDDDDDEDSD